jgi:hypothetical protein
MFYYISNGAFFGLKHGMERWSGTSTTNTT